MTILTKTIPKGYKQTEIGVIPVDWDVKEIRQVADVVGGGTPSTDIAENWNGKINWFTPTEIGISKYVYESSRKLSETGFKHSSSKLLPKNSILMTSRAGIGDLSILRVEASTNQGFQSLVPSESINSEFLYYLMLTKKNDLLARASGSTFLEISPSNVRSLLIQCPQDKNEQNTIATALSDIDALIEKTESLIEKKKSIKQGAMQELLIGKRRLSGFSGDWEESPISKFTWFQEGPGVRTEQFTSSGVKLLNGTNIYKGKLLLDNTNRFISESEAFGPYSHFLVDKGDIVIASSGITVDKFEEKISFVKESHLPLCMNTSTIRFKILNDSMDSLFLYYFFMSKKFKNQIGAQATGSAQLNFGPSHLQKVDIYLPKNKNEQTAIATILSDMDTEIEKLESELTKWRDMKQGMMQTLLTGKIRLIK